MKIITRKVPKNFTLYLFGDAHVGSALFYRKGFTKMVDEIRKNPHALAIDFGDAIEAIATDDKRFESDTVDQPIPLKQANDYIKLISPIRDKIICRLLGNHEHKLHRFGNLAQYICSTLDIEYGTYEAKIIFQDENVSTLFKGFVTHGFRSITNQAFDPIQRQANMQARLKRLLSEKQGDVLFAAMGHTHKLLIAEPTNRLWLSDDGINIKQKYTRHDGGDYMHPDHRWFFNTGSFMKLYHEGISSYASLAGYDPVELGYLKVEVKRGTISSAEKVIL